jgi:hypothetical protein
LRAAGWLRSTHGPLETMMVIMFAFASYYLAQVRRDGVQRSAVPCLALVLA